MGKRYILVGRQLYDTKDAVSKALFNSSDPETWQEIVDKLNAHIEPELWERVKTALENISANAKSYKFASEIQKTAKLEHIRLKAEAILKEIDDND